MEIIFTILYFCRHLKFSITIAGDIGQQLRTLATLVEEMDLIPSTHTEVYKTSSKEPSALFWYPPDTHT